MSQNRQNKGDNTEDGKVSTYANMLWQTKYRYWFLKITSAHHPRRMKALKTVIGFHYSLATQLE